MPPTVLFLPYPSASGTWGSTVGLARVAAACRRRGHRVLFHACPPTAAYLRRRGFEVIEFRGAEPRPAAAVTSVYDACTALGFDDEAFWHRVLRAERDLVAAVRPQVIVAHFRLSAPLTATRHGIPLLSVVEWSTDPRVQAGGDHALDALARRLAASVAGLGVDTLPELLWSSWADAGIATSQPELEPTLAGVPNVIHTGHLGADGGSLPPAASLPPLLLAVYASSAPWGTDILLRALGRAAARVGATAWCVTRAGERPRDISEHLRVVPYLPMDAALAHASGVVFHGGKSTAVAALAHGVPALAIPAAHYERAYNALRLQQLGAGLVGELTDLRAARLAPLLEHLLYDDTLRTRAPSPGAGSTGADLAAHWVERLIDTGRHGLGLLARRLPGEVSSDG